MSNRMIGEPGIPFLRLARHIKWVTTPAGKLIGAPNRSQNLAHFLRFLFHSRIWREPWRNALLGM